MNMKHAILGFLAETSAHPGVGRGMGVVDLPVAREAATDYPVLAGSSLKGALRDKAGRCEAAQGHARQWFGDRERERAGELLISDGRLLLLPVRSLMESYRWATCPHLLERFRRDRLRAGAGSATDKPITIEPGQALAAGEGPLILEERQFEILGEPSAALVDTIKPLLLHHETRKRLQHQIAVLHNDDFVWFARYGLAIQARNELEENTKRSKNLWYEESLPPDTVMYALVAGRDDEVLKALDTLFPGADPYLQVGGNETLGQGWFAVTVHAPEQRWPS